MHTLVPKACTQNNFRKVFTLGIYCIDHGAPSSTIAAFVNDCDVIGSTLINCGSGCRLSCVSLKSSDGK
jgi:hypothetical protein